MSQKAAFRLDDFIFNEVKLSFDKEANPEPINVDFIPSGVFNSEEHSFELQFTFIAFNDGKKDDPFVKINCIGTFSFENVKVLDDIPSFFYRNAIAILFPYVRAFVSSITAQANIAPMILPTYNLGALEEPLKENTTTK